MTQERKEKLKFQDCFPFPIHCGVLNLLKKTKQPKKTKKEEVKNMIKPPQTLQEYGFDLFSQPASQDLLQCGYIYKVQPHFTRSEVLIKHSRFFDGSQQVGKLHLSECNMSMQRIWMHATFWHEMTGKDLLNCWTMPMQGPVVLKGCPDTFTSFSF